MKSLDFLTNRLNEQKIIRIAEQLPYLHMLVLFGSRATGKAKDTSDWDFAALYDEEMRQAIANSGKLSRLNIYSYLSNIFDLPAEKIDIVRLNECSETIAHVVARDGLLIYERDIGEFDRFQLKSLLSEQDLKQLQQSTIKELRTFTASQRKKYGN